MRLECQRNPQLSINIHSIRFRNYVPRDDELQKKVDNVVVNEKPLDYETDLKASTVMPGVGEYVQCDHQRNDEINLASRKPNWDLKRGIEHKMEILEKRTQKAMIRLLSRIVQIV